MEQDTADTNALFALVLDHEADWLTRAHANSVDKGFSEEYRRGFLAAAGWVRFHAEMARTGTLEVKDGEVRTTSRPLGTG